MPVLSRYDHNHSLDFRYRPLAGRDGHGAEAHVAAAPDLTFQRHSPVGGEDWTLELGTRPRHARPSAQTRLPSPQRHELARGFDQKTPRENGIAGKVHWKHPMLGADVHLGGDAFAVDRVHTVELQHLPDGEKRRAEVGALVADSGHSGLLWWPDRVCQGRLPGVLISC